MALAVRSKVALGHSVAGSKALGDRTTETHEGEMANMLGAALFAIEIFMSLCHEPDRRPIPVSKRVAMPLRIVKNLSHRLRQPSLSGTGQFQRWYKLA
jgi:hypothetical protein